MTHVSNTKKGAVIWKCECSVKFCKRSESIRTSYMASFFRDMSVNWFLSTGGFGNQMKLKLGVLPLFSICMQCQCVFVFSYIIFHPGINAAVCWHHYDYRPTGSFQIPFLGSCPLSIAKKILLISLPRSGQGTWFLFQSDKRPILFPDLGSVWSGFKRIIIFQKSMSAKFYSDNYGDTDYNL